MSITNFSSFTFIAIQAALKAATLLMRGFGTNYEIIAKPGRQNFVTEYDKAAEACIISLIQEHFPSHSFLAEESGLTHYNKDHVLWIIDPLDGTTNFAHHIPIITISIAAYHQDQALCGVIFQPFTQELFVAEKDKGSYLNGTRLQVSQTQQIEDALIFASFPYDMATWPKFNLEKLLQLTQGGAVLRNLGSAALALAYVAAGKADACWMYNLYPWDLAAGQLLIEEAGGSVSRYNGEANLYSSAHILASNPALHNPLQTLFLS